MGDICQKGTLALVGIHRIIHRIHKLIDGFGKHTDLILRLHLQTQICMSLCDFLCHLYDLMDRFKCPRNLLADDTACNRSRNDPQDKNSQSPIECRRIDRYKNSAICRLHIQETDCTGKFHTMKDSDCIGKYKYHGEHYFDSDRKRYSGTELLLVVKLHRHPPAIF